jgi:hypothetical protein
MVTCEALTRCVSAPCVAESTVYCCGSMGGTGSECTFGCTAAGMVECRHLGRLLEALECSSAQVDAAHHILPPGEWPLNSYGYTDTQITNT